ncbi:MAG TPA: PqqD family protein [Candidatus Krumholzibacteria bacterium]|nr:PqqD family protein [Candidatus Krumholzibacteria bacterium]HPD73232.1 PqqD family protein [Candidatus Krumholzibacteria bacterium]HRY40194.1 PqqD family protein [Candidatus Krumholzibacteria bacterium]
MDLQAIPVPNPDFCVRQVGEETVFLAESGSQFLSLNPVGSFIWRQVDGVHTLQDILDILCDEYDVAREAAHADLLEFVEHLAEQGVVDLQRQDA